MMCLKLCKRASDAHRTALRPLCSVGGEGVCADAPLRRNVKLPFHRTSPKSGVFLQPESYGAAGLVSEGTYERAVFSGPEDSIT